MSKGPPVGALRDVVTVTRRRRVSTGRSWKYQDTDIDGIPAEIVERSGAREEHQGAEIERVDVNIWTRPLGVKGIKLNDELQVTARDGRVYDVIAKWPQPRGIPIWWKLVARERRSPNDA